MRDLDVETSPMTRLVEAFNNYFHVGSGQSELYRKLIDEEYEEFIIASYNEDIPEDEELKELCDLIYVLLGYALQRGWDVDRAFNRVHSSNMSKLGKDGKPVYNKDGKVVKGPNYVKPNLKDLV